MNNRPHAAPEGERAAGFTMQKMFWACGGAKKLFPGANGYKIGCFKQYFKQMRAMEEKPCSEKAKKIKKTI